MLAAVPYTALVCALALATAESASFIQECRNKAQCAAIHAFDIDVSVDGEEAAVSWNFNSSQVFYGFNAFITTDNEMVYESPMMHIEERQMKVEKDFGGGKHQVCLQVWSNSTTVTMVNCNSFSQPNYKVVIGILAGVVFLVPCVIGLIFIIYKDRQNIANENYRALLADSDLDPENSENNGQDKELKRNPLAVNMLGQNNVGFLEEGKGKIKPRVDNRAAIEKVEVVEESNGPTSATTETSAEARHQSVIDVTVDTSAQSRDSKAHIWYTDVNQKTSSDKTSEFRDKEKTALKTTDSIRL